MQFLDLIQRAPLAYDAARAEAAFAELSRTEAAAPLQAALADANGRAFLEGVFDGSPFLAHAAKAAPDAFARLLEEGPDAVLDAAVLDARQTADEPDLKRAMRILRAARLRGALAIGLADLAGVWRGGRATEALTRMADAAVAGAIDWLVADAGRRNVLEARAGGALTDGLIVLGMGKLGAFELNYSSDVDLILFYDAERVPIRRPDRLPQEMTRLARALGPLLEERTRDGYAYRTDLRLRPDPASTPPAVSMRAAEVYYAASGQNWERAAMIKARPVAGDIAAGAQFLRDLRPFVWRRSLDFNSIRDIQSIKRQIVAREGDRMSAFGHNVKLGRGGIREVEFFVQTQQLIWGGRDGGLRVARTIDGLDALVDAGHVPAKVAQELEAAYLKLRDIEHRLQMVDDRQTHVTPDAEPPERADRFARFAGYPSRAAFADDLVATLETVEGHFAALYPDEPGLGGGGALSFTGADDHPDTLATIARMGFAAPERITQAIRGWHHGRVRAARHQRAREILTEITPDLLQRFSAMPDPDRAFAAFERFVAGLPAGVQFFSLLQANRPLLDFLARVLGRSAYLAALIGRRPQVLDAVLTDGFGEPPGTRAELTAELLDETHDALDLQDRLDCARRWLNDLRLRLGVQTIEAGLAPARAAAALADAADVVANAMLTGVTQEFEENHGKVPGAAFALIGYGKWGSRERTIGSDLDMVAIYDAPENARSDGARALPAPVYFMRLTQRFITAMSASTGEGRLFEIDMRLRPTGADGPIATHFATLEAYLFKDAWTWELMALSRARFAVGDTGLGARFEALRAAALAEAPMRPDLLGDVARMRARVAAAKPAGGPWDVRGRAGGMVDAEFLAQGLALRHGADPAIAAARGPADQLRALGRIGALQPDCADDLADAATFWLEAQWLTRLIGHDPSGPEVNHPESQATFCTALGERDYAALVARRERIAERVHAAFRKYIGSAAPGSDAGA